MVTEQRPTREQFDRRLDQVKLENADADLADKVRRDGGYPFLESTLYGLAELKRENLAHYYHVRAIFQREGVPVRDLDEAVARFAARPNGEGTPATSIVTVSSTEFIARPFKPRNLILSPWLTEKSLNMVVAWRGTGKTNFFLCAGLASASGSSFLTFSAPAPRKVLYIDGELPDVVLQDRLKLFGVHPNLTIINPDLQPDLFIPNIGLEETQQRLAPAIEAHDVIILDSLATLAPASLEQDSERWSQLQPWLLKLRRDGKAVVIGHHTNKAGKQRGTSMREDILDVVIKLEAVENSDHCHFRLSYEKTRGLIPDSAKILEAQLISGEWRTDDGETTLIVAAADLCKEKKSVREIAKVLHCSKSQAHRYIASATDRGLLL